MEFYKDRFSEIRKKLRWSITSLAKESSTCRQSISTWENGRNIPSEKKIRQLAKVMGINVSDISNLVDTYPHSEHNLSDSIQGNLLEQSFDIKFIKPNIDKIYTNLNEINAKLGELSLVTQSLLKYSNNYVYIKDQKGKYIIANQRFLKILKLTENYSIKYKTDQNLYNEKEAKLNTEQDNKVINTGEPILDYEQHIFGTRKKRWGIYSKIPILDIEGKISGLLNVAVDITERKKQERYKEILEYAISNLNSSVWVAKNINEIPGLPLWKEIIFSSANLINVDSI